MNQPSPLRIVMFTNTFAPHVGGVALSVESFSGEFRRRGHQVLVVAPEFEGRPEREANVVRIPAIQRFNGSDFSVALTTPSALVDRLELYDPHIVHAHHPFLLGNEAARFARSHGLPLVFTHHTLYEQYTHYVPADSSLLQRFVIELATSYANMCDHVFAPSESIAGLLEARGVEVPIAVVPTGVNYELFSTADGKSFRQDNAIADDAFVVGHVGRLAPEKNLRFLAKAVAAFLKERSDAHFLLVGQGPLEKEIRHLFQRLELSQRLTAVGQLDHQQLRHAYAAMNVFAFASRSETQGMVLTEAMAAGTPVVAVEASGVREVVSDRHNGRLVFGEDHDAFLSSLHWVAELAAAEYATLRHAASETGQAYSLANCADRALSIYAQLSRENTRRSKDPQLRNRLVKLIAAEWEILSTGAQALGIAAVDQLSEGDVGHQTEFPE